MRTSTTEDRFLDNYDDIEIAESLDLIEPKGRKRINLHTRKTGHSRWRSVEEYREWKELHSQVSDMLQASGNTVKKEEWLDNIH